MHQALNHRVQETMRFIEVIFHKAMVAEFGGDEKGADAASIKEELAVLKKVWAKTNNSAVVPMQP